MLSGGKATDAGRTKALSKGNLTQGLRSLNQGLRSQKQRPKEQKPRQVTETEPLKLSHGPDSSYEPVEAVELEKFSLPKRKKLGGRKVTAINRGTFTSNAIRDAKRSLVE